MALDEYCRAIEAHLCRKNDGHLIRIVGPAFERVVSWAEQGIPLNVSLAGIDRYFERYYRKGTRRRPVRVEFCDADVRDAFDEWRRAVGVSIAASEASPGAPSAAAPVAASRPRRSLRTHIEALLVRLTALRGSDRLGASADEPLAGAVRAIEPLLQSAEHVRGDQRQAVFEALAAADRDLIERLLATLPEERRVALAVEAGRTLEPFRDRMSAAAYEQACRAQVARLIREHFDLPEIGA